MSADHTLIRALPAVLAALFFGVSAFAQDSYQVGEGTGVQEVSALEDVTKAIQALSAELLLNLPSDGTYSIKSLTDSTDGIPKDILTQLNSNLQSSLLLASQFEMTLIDQGQLGESWANAVEFNGADFEELVQNANFDAIIILNTRATKMGIELSLQAIGATATNSGQVLASTNSSVVPLNWEEVSGVNVSSIDEKLAELRKEIEKIKSSGVQVSNPVSFADYMANAQIQEESGNIDSAISSYVRAAEIDSNFYDPIYLSLKLAIIKYGTDEANNLLAGRLSKKLSSEQLEFANLLIFPESEIFETCDYNMENHGETTCNIEPFEGYSPATVALWLTSQGSSLADLREKGIEGRGLPYVLDYILLGAARKVISAYEDGLFSEQFISSKIADEVSNVDEARRIEARLNKFSYAVSEREYQIGTGQYAIAYKTNSGGSLLPFVVDGSTVEINDTPWYLADRGSFMTSVHASVGTVEHNLNSLGPCGLQITGGLGGGEGNFWETFTVEDFDPLSEIRSLSESRKIPLLPQDLRISENDWIQLYDLPLAMASSRLAWADLCLALGANSRSREILDGNVNINIITGLLITDSVDISKPVFVISGEASWPNAISDVSKDGSYIEPLGVYFYRMQMQYPRYAPNPWFYVPGSVEGMVNQTCISEVRYTDTKGRQKILRNGFRLSSSDMQTVQGGDRCSSAPDTQNLNRAFFRVPAGSNRSETFFDELESAVNVEVFGAFGGRVALKGTGSPTDLDLNNASAFEGNTNLSEQIKSAFVNLTENERKTVQENLASYGYYGGVVDGLWGKQTESAILSSFDGAYFPAPNINDPVELNSFVQSLVYMVNEGGECDEC